MKYLVRMNVSLPRDLAEDDRQELVAREKQYSQQLQREGKWPQIWRVVGQYANYSIFEVGTHDELHQILQGLPLFPFMDIEVTPLAAHPSDIKS
ncbi:muconolactone Delta-isomerase [Nesterenkonia sphaerica]|uniref:Muconolactone Delta-isomerase n=1 Tax=Nesterenkonia sphaerica TaxID=1804988 RepID=A0A5R9AMW2_9MICC|nr:muconolactone Delta-isomerase [Nesterenkonia sphaerica]TLP79967.1 muconolactone Delta-isomerase [Nesterenkonia sphaerica]